MVKAPEELIGRALPESVRRLGAALGQHRFRAWAVGGSVRDVLLGALRERPIEIGDWDVATDARPEQVQAIFPKVIPTGILHGTVTVLISGASIEVTTLRGEEGHSDGRRPDRVFFVSDLTEDLARRDFTVNAMAFDLEAGTFHDPFDGLGDLKKGIIRAVGDAKTRYFEDGLRPLRGARFAAQLEMTLEEETRKAIPGALERFSKVSLERVHKEWWKALASRAPSRCFHILLAEGLLSVTWPELFVGSSMQSLPLETLDRPELDPAERLAALLSLGLSGEFGTGASRGTAATALLKRLKCSNSEVTDIAALLAAEDLPSNATGPEVRRWLSARTRARAPRALHYCQHRYPEAAWLQTAARELESGTPLEERELALSGRELIEGGLCSPGPRVKTTLRFLLDQVLATPAHNDKATLLELARGFLAAAN